MNHDLYFIPILFEALDKPDIGVSLRRAFRDIVARRSDPRFTEGYRQFLAFMQTVFQHEAEIKDDSVSWEPGELLDELRALPEARDVWSSVRVEREEDEREDTFDFILRREGGNDQALSISRSIGGGSFRDISEGRYELSLASGRVIWESLLEKQDLLVVYAFPGRPLRVAADTGTASEEATREVRLLKGEVRMRVFPGTRSGRMEIELCLL